MLFYFATGPVRGLGIIGITLTIGVLASMPTCLVLSRMLLELLVSRRRIRQHLALSGLAGESRVRRWLMHRQPFLLRRHRRWLAASALAVTVAAAGIGIKGLRLRR